MLNSHTDSEVEQLSMRQGTQKDGFGLQRLRDNAWVVCFANLTDAQTMRLTMATLQNRPYLAGGARLPPTDSAEMMRGAC